MQAKLHFSGPRPVRLGVPRLAELPRGLKPSSAIVPPDRVASTSQGIPTRGRQQQDFVLGQPVVGAPPSAPLPAPPQQQSTQSKQVELLTRIYLNDAVDERLSATQDEGPSTSISRRPALKEGLVHYFAFGANMHVSTLVRRDVRVLSRDPCKVCSPDVRLRFRHRGGYATLVNAKPSEYQRFEPYTPNVHGVLFTISKEDLKKLKKRESGYELKEIEVETYDGMIVKAMAFTSHSLAMLPEELPPPEAYMRLLREGAADNFLDPTYQAWLSSVDTVTSAGLPNEYYNTPGKYVAYSFMLIAACVVSAFFLQ